MIFIIIYAIGCVLAFLRTYSSFSLNMDKGDPKLMLVSLTMSLTSWMGFIIGVLGKLIDKEPRWFS